MYKAIQASRVYEQIVSQIQEAILSGSLKPGDRLPAERELTERFGVSRTAVREAIKTLREKGLVEAYAGRGTFITGVTSRPVRRSLGWLARLGLPGGAGEGLAQLAEVRRILEPEIAARAAIRAGQEHLAAMRGAVAAMDAAGQDAQAFIEADLDFHLALAGAAGNPLILTLIDSIVVLLREQRLRVFFVRGGPAHGQIHHRRIMDAVERRDAAGARDAMRVHLEQVTEDLAADVDTPPAEGDAP